LTPILNFKTKHEVAAHGKKQWSWDFCTADSCRVLMLSVWASEIHRLVLFTIQMWIPVQTPFADCYSDT